MKGVTVERNDDKDIVAAIARLNRLVERLYANQLESAKLSSLPSKVSYTSSKKQSLPSKDPHASIKKQVKFRGEPE
jgi:hypothetical protein